MSLPTPYYHDEDAGITIYHADCRDILPLLPKVDLVLTDPPYGVTANRWDDFEITKTVFDLFTCSIVCTCQNPASAELICRYKNRFKWSDVFVKTQARGFLSCKVMPLRKHEDILVFANGKITFTPQITKKPAHNIRPISISGRSDNYGSFKGHKQQRTIEIDEQYPTSIINFANPQNGFHPTEKPIGLMKYLINSYSHRTHTILDPFMGSGTTAVACKQLHRKCIGIEIEEKILPNRSFPDCNKEF